MPEIALFVEDYGHATVLQALLRRLQQEFSVPVTVRELSAQGGHGQVETEFRQFVHDVNRFASRVPDLIILATDANCEGFRDRKKRMQQVAGSLSDRIVYCIPDPHLERWLLLDSAAFKKVIGAGCKAPDLKCNRDRYKRLLAEAIIAAGQTPILGGLEHADDLINHMQIEKMAQREASFGDLMNGLKMHFRQWSEK